MTTPQQQLHTSTMLDENARTGAREHQHRGQRCTERTLGGADAVVEVVRRVPLARLHARAHEGAVCEALREQHEDRRIRVAAGTVSVSTHTDRAAMSRACDGTVRGTRTCTPGGTIHCGQRNAQSDRDSGRKREKENEEGKE